MSMSYPTNDLGQWAVGQLYPNWELPLVRDRRVMDLTGVISGQLSLVVYNANKAVIGGGAGFFQIKNAKPGVVVYTQGVADMATAGTFYLRVKINFNGATPDYSDYIRLVINA